MGPTRSTRLPRAIDEWFSARLTLRPEASASEFLVALIHGGLRLREGYMAVHRRQLEDLAAAGREREFDTYLRCLLDTFGPATSTTSAAGSRPTASCRRRLDGGEYGAMNPR